VDWDEWLELRFGSRNEQWQYVGLEAEEALKIAQADGVTDIRVLDLSAPEGVFLHDDQRGYRLNLAVRDKRVVRAAFF
jgi:hypothetical protein